MGETIFDADFTSDLICEDTWIIRERGNTAYLLCGDSEGFMIDSGDSTLDLRAYAESLCGKPVRKVMNTHGHFDHTGGNGFFETAYMTNLAAQIARTPNGGQPIEKYPLDYEIVVIEDGDVIGVEGRMVDVFLMDSHSPGSVMFLDKKQRLLFTGDNLARVVPLWYKCPHPQPSIARYAMYLSKVMEHRDEFDYICHGHAEEKMSGDMVNDALAAAERALAGNFDPEPPPKPKPPKGATVVHKHHGPDGKDGPHGDKMHKDGGPGKNDMASNREFATSGGVTLMFDKRYVHDTTYYDVVIGT